MNRKLKVLAVLGAITIIALLGGATAFAQNAAPGAAEPGANGFGRRQGTPLQQGLLAVDQEQMHAAIADALGISVGELEAARAEGTPLVIIAQELGVEITAVREAMTAVRETAVNQALAEGMLTGEQAEWLLSRPAFRMGSAGGRGMGRAQGGNGQGNGCIHNP